MFCLHRQTFQERFQSTIIPDNPIQCGVPYHRALTTLYIYCVLFKSLYTDHLFSYIRIVGEKTGKILIFFSSFATWVNNINDRFLFLSLVDSLSIDLFQSCAELWTTRGHCVDSCVVVGFFPMLRLCVCLFLNYYVNKYNKEIRYSL